MRQILIFTGGRAIFLKGEYFTKISEHQTARKSFAWGITGEPKKVLLKKVNNSPCVKKGQRING